MNAGGSSNQGGSRYTRHSRRISVGIKRGVAVSHCDEPHPARRVVALHRGFHSCRKPCRGAGRRRGDTGRHTPHRQGSEIQPAPGGGRETGGADFLSRRMVPILHAASFSAGSCLARSKTGRRRRLAATELAQQCVHGMREGEHQSFTARSPASPFGFGSSAASVCMSGLSRPIFTVYFPVP